MQGLNHDTSAVPERDKKSARPSGRLVFVSIFARGRVRRRCSREGTVQLSDAVAFESILKLHHPLYEKLEAGTERRPLSRLTKIDKNSNGMVMFFSRHERRRGGT